MGVGKIASEESLRESEEKYRALVENSPDLVGIIQDGTLKYVNEAASRKLGWTIEELLSFPDPIGKLITEEHADLIRMNMVRRLRGEEVAPYEIGLVAKNGLQIPALVHGARIMYKGKPADEFLFVDISERKRAENELREVENKLLALHRHAFHIGSTTSIDEIVTRTLDAIELALGFEVADFYIVENDYLRAKGARGKPLEFQGEDLNGPGLVAKAARSQETIRVTDTRQEPDYVDRMGFDWKQTPTVLSELAVPVIVDGRTVAVLNVEHTALGAFSDSDQRLLETLAAYVGSEMERLQHEKELEMYSKQLEALVKERTEELDREKEELKYAIRSNQFLETIVENAYIWINVLDKEKNVVIWNKAAERISGYSSEDVIGHSEIWEWLYPDAGYRKQIFDSVTEVLQLGKVEQDFETNIKRRDGETRVISWNERSFVGKDDEVIGSIAIGRDVSEKKRMEEKLETYSTHLEKLVEERSEKLRESEERYRSIVQNIPGMLWTSDENGDTVFVTPNVKELYGYSPEEIYAGGQAVWSKHIHPDDGEKLRKGYMKLFTDGSVFDVEYRYQRPDGKRLWLHDRAHLVYEKDGVRYTNGVTTNVTERKRAEEEMRESKEELEHVLATNPAVLFYEEARPDFSDTLTRYVSESASFVLGFEPEKFLGESGLSFWRSRVHPDDLARYYAELPHLWRDGQHSFEYRFLHGDGTYRWIADQYRVIRDPEGRITNTVTVAIDVTERKTLEEKLAKAESRERERLELIIGSNPAAIFLEQPSADRSDFVSTYMSKSVSSLTGFNAEDFLGEAGADFWASRVHPDDLKQYRAEMPTLWKNGHHTFEFRFLHKDGTYHWIREKQRVIVDAEGNVQVVGYESDVTDRKRLEEELVRSQRLAAIGETARMVGHDLRNPLQGIAGATEVLRKLLASASNAVISEMLDVLDQDVKYSDKIITDLLEYSGEIRLAESETNLKLLIEESLRLVPRPNRITIHDLTDEMEVSVDPQEIKRVFINLIKNAYDAMLDGGEITIANARSNGILEISFSDTGAGIKDEVIQKLWKEPVTTKAKGLGLGLAISKRIVEAHGGTIAAMQRSDGRGTVVKVMLPINHDSGSV